MQPEIRNDEFILCALLQQIEISHSEKAMFFLYIHSHTLAY